MEPKQESDENTEEGDKYEGMGIAGYVNSGTVLACMGIWMTVLWWVLFLGSRLYCNKIFSLYLWVLLFLKPLVF